MRGQTRLTTGVGSRWGSAVWKPLKADQAAAPSRGVRKVTVVLGFLLGINDAVALNAVDNADVLNFCPSPTVQKALAGRRGSNALRFRLQPIESAKGGQPTNLDVYEVEISKLPTLPGSSAQATAAALYDHFRANVAKFLDEANSDFGPYDQATDGKTWAKPDPTGAMMLFDIKNKLGAIPLKPRGDRIERALVLTTYGRRDPTHMAWRFSTVGADDTMKPDFSAYGDHPVSGTREFGLRRRGAQWVLYTRGADRATGGLIDRLSRNDIFAGGDDLWKSFQDRAVAFVNANGGSAAKVAPERIEPAWDDLVSQGVAKLSCKWVKDAIEWASIGDRGSSALLSVRALGDSTGLTSAMLASAKRQLGAAKTQRERQAIFDTVEAAAGRLRAAATPKDVRDLVESPLGTALALSQARFKVVPQTLDLGRVDGRDAEQAKVFASGLLIGKASGMRTGDAQKLLEAVVGRSLPAGLDSYVRTDPATEPVLRGLVAVVSNPSSSSERAKLLVSQLTPLAKGLLDERTRAVAGHVQRLRSAQQAVTDVRSALGNLATTSSATNVQGVAAAVSTLVQNDLVPLPAEVKRQVGDTLQVVSTGMRAYQALSLAANLASGSALVSAMGMLASGGDLSVILGGPQDQGAKETLKAINELAAEVRRQFEVVNLKLDHITRQLDTLQTSVDALAGEVRVVQEQQRQALAKLDDIAEGVRHLTVRVDELEDAVLLAVKDNSALGIACTNHVRNRYRTAPQGNEFADCLTWLARAGSQFQRARGMDLGPSKVLADKLASSIDVGPEDRARYAWSVAVASAGILADKDLERYGDQQVADKVANGPAAAHFADLYVTMVRRWGRDYLLRPGAHADITGHIELTQLVASVDAASELQSLLMGPIGQREKRALTIVEVLREPSVAAAAAWTRARAAAFVDLATDARSREDRLDVGSYPVRRCGMPTGPVLFEISGDDAKTILPRSVLARGGATILPDRQERWLDRGVICIFDVQFEHQSRRQERDGEPTASWSYASVRAKIRVEFLGLTMGDRTPVIGPFLFHSATLLSGRSREGPTDDQHITALKAQFIERLREALQGDRAADDQPGGRLRAAVAENLEKLSSARVQRTAASLAAAKLDASGEDERKAAVGLVRGYFSTAYPNLYSTSDRLRALIDGSPVARVLDRDFLRQLGACSAAILADQAARPAAWTDDASSTAYTQLVKSESGDSPVCRGFSAAGTEFTAAALRDVSGLASARLDALRKTLQDEKLDGGDREESMSASDAQMSAIRLREFKEHGGKASYYASSY